VKREDVGKENKNILVGEQVSLVMVKALFG
jgi:hypothetical protein